MTKNMVTTDTRNNVIVIIILIATATLVSTFVLVFATSILNLAQHGENTVNMVGKSVAGNVSQSAEINRLNLMQFNKSMTDVIKSNDEIVQSNNNSINNLTDIVHNFNIANSKYLNSVNNNTGANSKLLNLIVKELQNISKKLDMVPVTPIPQPNPNCTIKTPGVCIGPNGNIIVNHK